MRLGRIIPTLLFALVATAALVARTPEDGSPESARARAHELMQQGNWKEALTRLSALATDPADDPEKAPDDMQRSTQCLANLGDYAGFDAFMEKAVAVHAKNPRVLAAASRLYLQAMHQGSVVAGAFERGPHRGGTARYVDVYARDRVRALKLLVQGLPLVAGDPGEAASYHIQLADALMATRWGQNAWALQVLTDLTKLPDPEEAYGYYGNQDRGAPVDEKGDPLFHPKPATWEVAQNDGQRWRWALARAEELQPATASGLRHRFAQFLRGQFDVQTLQTWGASFGRLVNDEKLEAGNPFALRSLAEDETIARLASGPKRFRLPDEFNFIRIWRELAQAGDTTAAQHLGDVFENRQQYPRAAAWYGKAGRKDKVDQITGHWGTLEQAGMQAAGAGATVDFRFRNATGVTFTARAIDVDRLIADARSYLEASPRDLKHERIDVSSIGYSLLNGSRANYLGAQLARWDLKLEPRPDHLDRRITVTTPLSRGGAYFLEAAVEGGNRTYQVIWVTDLAIVKKTLDRKVLYYVTDARTGVPAEATLDFFGYNTEWRDNWIGRGQRMIVHTDSAVATAGADGTFFALPGKLPDRFTWLVTAKDKNGRTGWLGWSGHGYGNWYDQDYNQQKSFFASDRPVYRPGHQAKFKFWLNQAQYDREGKSPYAGRRVRFQLTNPRGETVNIGETMLDEYGGGDGQWSIPADATLGAYNIHIENENASGSLRVEEYKKPEFEVTVDAPGDPVMLGEKFEAKIQARYLFGAPVKEGKIKYKVTRSDHDATWYPWAPWDWYYGRGYWWFACDYAWYPGWFEWGCKRPVRTWLHDHWRGWAPPQQQPEIVAENEAEIAPDGTVKVEIDTALAKATMGDTDHKYEITAEVTDKSRRTITGSGQVLVARKAFKVYAWLDSGHYKVGDAIEGRFNAQTVDGKPVAGTGELKLFRLAYDSQGQVTESEVQKWTLPTGPDGQSRQQLKASEPGQYRLAYTVTDAKQHAIEGGYVFVIGGPGFDGGDFRFNNLELVADRKEYRPGETVSLRVNTNQRDTTVLLFVRAANGVCQDPQVLTLKGKSATVDVGIVKKDMPNMFIEAITVSGARVHQEMLEIVVPPEDRVLGVKVTPAAEKVKPGAKTRVTVELTQADGKPYVGSLLVTMYDKAVEYISGGSNAGDIRELFWKWRRTHHPQRETNLDRADGPMVRNGDQAMGFLGVFGQFVAELDDGAVSGAKRNGRPGVRSRNKLSMAPGRGGGFGGARAEGQSMMLDAAAAPAPAMAGGLAAASEMRADSGMMKEEAESKQQFAGAGQPAQPAAATVRTNFADTAFWGAAITTDASGKATVDIQMPESLTTWKTRVWAMADGCRVGQADTQVITSKNLLIRLQAPRFFVEKDEVVLSANVHNYLLDKKSVQAVLELEGGTLEPLERESTRTVEIPAGGEARVDWRVRVTREGKAIVRMKALADEESDAMQMEFPVLVHGMLKTESFCGVIRPEASSSQLKLTVPAERKPEQSRLEIRYSPTLAMAMVDALPYLVEYPYGCTEQTMNRFLPTVLTQKVLIQMGVKLADVSEKITNLNAQEAGDDQKRSGDWKRLSGTMRWNGATWVARSPVFEEALVRDMIRSGVEKITAMQCSDGGWGWFSGYEEHSTAHITALVVHGLEVARFDDAAIPRGVMERGVNWLKGYQAEELRELNLPANDPHRKLHADALDAFVEMVLADATADEAAMRERIYKDRNELPVYAKAMLGLALHRVKDTEKRDMVIRNIDQFLVEDAENQTAYLKLPENNWWWYWYGSEYEAQAYYLKLLAAAQPKSEKASRLVKYLLNNRRNATYWNSTRDTAIVVEAFADYIAATGEDRPDLEVEILLDGKSAKKVKIASANLFTYDNKLVLTGPAVTTGAHNLELRKTGTGPLYWNAYLTNFTQEDHITKAGLEVKVERAVYKLVREDAAKKVAGDRGQVLEQKVEKYRREPLADLSTLKSGELCEVELTVESKNDYEYILLEDPKAAGFEAVEVRSGYNGNDMGAYVEFRDQKVCFFIRELARGKHSVAYRLRAEIPGKFSALPTRIAAMYAPELKGNSDEIQLRIED